MKKPPRVLFGGLNNKLQANELQDSKTHIREAVDVMFTASGELKLNCNDLDDVAIVSGTTVSSVYDSGQDVFFVQGGVLRTIDIPSLAGSVGSSKFSYSKPIGNFVYLANGTVQGRFEHGDSTLRLWGIPSPSSQPIAVATQTGDMPAGKYRVAVKWIDVKDRESGGIPSVVVDVPEGGGIALSSFPSGAPSGIDRISVWLTEVDGVKLRLYGEYPISTTSLNLIKKELGPESVDDECFAPVIPANSPICEHQGRIYWADGNLLRYTHIGPYGSNYDQTLPFNYMNLDGSNVRVILSCGRVLYVGTDQTLFKLFNIDSQDESPVIIQQISLCSSVAGSECYEYASDSGYFVTSRGVIAANEQGITELTFDKVAMPIFPSGFSTIIEMDGLKHLIFFGTGGVKNPLANRQWNETDWGSDVEQDSDWIVNLGTGAISKGSGFGVNSASGHYAGKSNGLFKFGLDSNKLGRIKTGDFYFFGGDYKKRIDNVGFYYKGGPFNLKVNADNGSATYTLRPTSTFKFVYQNVAKGLMGRTWSFELEALSQDTTTIIDMIVGLP